MTVAEVVEAVEAVVTPGTPNRLFLKQVLWPVPSGTGLFLFQSPPFRSMWFILGTTWDTKLLFYSCTAKFFSYICGKIVEMKRLTKKEEVIMNHFWNKGPLFVRELRELYPEPRPHFSTLSTQVRTLQEEGFIDHKAYGPTYQYFAKVTREEYKQRSLIGLIDKYFDNSYLSAVSALVKEEKVTVDELKELIALVEESEEK